MDSCAFDTEVILPAGARQVLSPPYRRVSFRIAARDNIMGCEPGAGTGTGEGEGRKALITGASPGIGESWAHCFAASGHGLVRVARRRDNRAALAAVPKAEHGARVTVLPADLALADAARALVAALQRRRMAVDALVDEAGVLEQGAFVAMPARQHQRLIDPTVSGLTAKLARFAPPRVWWGVGRVLNVACVAAFQPVSTRAACAATEACALSLSESLAEQVKGTGATVTLLCPGISPTGMPSGTAQASAQLDKLPVFMVGDGADAAAAAHVARQRDEVIREPGAVTWRPRRPRVLHRIDCCGTSRGS